MHEDRHQVVPWSTAPLAVATRHLQLLHKLFPTEPEFEWLRNPGSHLAKLMAKAEQGDVNAQETLAYYYWGGQIIETPTRQDFAEAARWSRRAAEQGSRVGQCNLGVAYREGKGLQKDDVEAARWFRMAAEQGAAIAQSNLALMYLRGEGVQKDSGEGMRWYQMAAQQGDAVAQRNLGVLLQGGYGVDADFAQAVRWLREAALSYNFGAMDQLGLAYYAGRGVGKDEIEGLAWLIVKTGLGRDTDGHEQSEQTRKRMEQALGPEKTAVAQTRCRELVQEISARRRARSSN